MSAQPTSRRRVSMFHRLSLEPLESRQVLSAGSVVVAAPVGGVLTITGDNSDDAVAVSGSTTDAGTFTITGLHGTTVNGVVNGSVTETGVTAIQTALWGNGNDFFSFSDANSTGLAGDLTVAMGNGNDKVQIGSAVHADDDGDADDTAATTTTLAGNVSVTLGNGNDKVGIANVSETAPQGMLVTLGNGNDKVDAHDVTLAAAGDVDGDQGFGVVMGGGNDKFEADHVTVSVSGTTTARQGFGVMMGDGNDKVEANHVSVNITGTASGNQGLGVQLGNGNDKVRMGDVAVTGGQGLAVVLGNGNDDVNLGAGHDWGRGANATAAIDVTGDVLVQLGTGKDSVNASGVTTGGGFDIEKTSAGGSGAQVRLNRLTVGGDLTVNLAGDTGRDELKVSNTTVTGSTTFTGGSGTNDDYDPGNGNSFATPPVVTGFEK